MSNFGTYKLVKTRKEHKCIFCNRTIPTGTNAYNCNGIWQDNWQNWYACEFCENNVVAEYYEQGEEITGDEFREWFLDTEHCICKKCGAKRCYEWEWVEPTKIKVECDDCEETWEVEIGFK